MFRQLFEEGLELQKARLREQRAYAREKRLEHQRRHQDQIKSMENYYKDQVGKLHPDHDLVLFSTGHILMRSQCWLLTTVIFCH